MKEWIYVRAGDFIEFNPRLNIKKGITATKISMDKLQPFSKKILGAESAVFTGGAKFRNGDTIMARITPCLENGKTAFVDILNDGEIGFGSTEFIVLRARKGISDPQFIYYLATSPFFRKQAIKSMVGSSGRQRVQQNVLDNLELKVPDIVTQEKIGYILSCFDKKIAINKQINDNLEKQAVALYQSLFVNYARLQKKEFVQSELGNMPTGWSVKSLSDVTTNIRTRVRGNNYKVLSAINSGCLQPSEEYFTKQVFSKDISNYIVVEENDFAYNPSRINIGSIGLNALGYTGCVSPIYVVFRTEPEYHFFMDFFIKSPRFNEEIRARASGSVRQAVGYKDFGLIRLIYPPLSVVQQFNNEYEKILMCIKRNLAENLVLENLRDVLLSKLMTGEFDLSNIDF